MPAIQVQYSTTGTIYALIRDTSGNIWNGSSFVAYATADLGSYDIPLTQQGTASRYYAATFPVSIADGVYAVTAYAQASGTPSETDTVIASGTMTIGATTAELTSAGVDAVFDESIGDGTLTMRQALRVLIAGMAGKLSGAATTTVTIRNAADTANVIVATVDSDGNRSAVTVTP